MKKTTQTKGEKINSVIKDELKTNPDVNESSSKKISDTEHNDLDDDETKQAKSRRVTFTLKP